MPLVRLVLAVAVASAPAQERASVEPLAITGALEPEWRKELGARMQAGLARGDTEIVARSTASDCRDEACWRDLARTSDAAFVVVGSVVIVERDYDLHIEVRAAKDGAIVLRVDQRCELCGIGEAAQQLSDLAAAVAAKLDALASARATLAIESVPTGAAITLDGAEIGTAPLSRDVVPGTHDVGASLSGYRTQLRAIEAAAGVQQLVRFELIAQPATRSDRKHLRRLGWALLGLGAAGVIAGGSLVAIDERPVTGNCTGENVNAFGVCKYRHDTLAGGAALIGVGAAAIVAGTVIAIVTHARKRKR
ncbi:MAG TPA: PEGA domain-containing protein [Nannocystaceae bacterium]|nr:PEGA domain-containing protein [Nannocystaceae bacterium]